MSLEKINLTKWLLDIDMGDFDSMGIEIKAKKDGLDINDNIIPWAEIDAARAVLAEETIKRIGSILCPPVTQTWGDGITTQPTYRDEQERINQKMRKLLDANPLAKVEAKMMKPIKQSKTLKEVIKRLQTLKTRI